MRKVQPEYRAAGRGVVEDDGNLSRVDLRAYAEELVRLFDFGIQRSRRGLS